MKNSKSYEYIFVGDVGILKLTSKKFGARKFFFDAEDYNRIKSFNWVFKPNKDGHDYLHASIGNNHTGFGSTISFHRLITSFEFPIVDHVDRNTYDNRKKNLRGVTKSQNLSNSHTHDLKGIRVVRGMYEPTVIINGKDVKLGRTSDLDEAKLIFRTNHFKQNGEFSPYTITGELK